MFELFLNGKVKLDVSLKILEMPNSMQNHVQRFNPLPFTKPFSKKGAFTSSEDVASHGNPDIISVIDSIKYSLSTIDNCRVGASEHEAKNSARKKSEEGKNHGNIAKNMGDLKMVNNRATLSGPLQSAQLIIKPRQLTKQDITELSSFGKILGDEFMLERSPRGYTLKTPVKIPLKDIYEVSSKSLVKYVLASLSQERPKLAPYIFKNKSLLKLANYLLRYRTGSYKTLYLYVDCIWRYTNRAGLSPDQLTSDVKDENGLPKPHRIPYHIKALEDYICELQDAGLAPSRICNYVKAIRALYRVNGIDIKLPQPLSRRAVRHDRAPKPDELQRVIDIADLRERVIVSMLALG